MSQEKSIPEVLYRYRPLTGTDKNNKKLDITSCEEGYLWFSDKDGFNDPFEFKTSEVWRMPSVEVYQRALEENSFINLFFTPEVDRAIHLQNMEMFEYYFREHVYCRWEEKKEELIKSTKCCCFSEIPNNHEMWTKYADALKGVSFGYATSRLLEGINGCSGPGVTKVDYLEKEEGGFPEINVSDFFLGDHKEFVESFFKKTFATKSVHWEREREWRIVTSFDDNKYIYPRDALVEVVFGERTAECDRRLIIDALSDVDVQYKEAYCSENHYKIEIRDL